MTPEKIIEQAELMIRYAKSVQEGNPLQIEFRESGRNVHWVGTEPRWNLSTYEYREKPKPYECFLVLTKGGQLIGKFEVDDTEAGKAYARNNDLVCRHVREVEDGR